MASQKTIQQRFILLIALLGILHLQDNRRPTRKKVLAFIKIKRLMNWNEHEIDWVDDHCRFGENYISWRRKDFVEGGLIVDRPGTIDWGIWELSDTGLAKAELLVDKLFRKMTDTPSFVDDLKRGLPEMKLADGFFDLVRCLAVKIEHPQAVNEPRERRRTSFLSSTKDIFRTTNRSS